MGDCMHLSGVLSVGVSSRGVVWLVCVVVFTQEPSLIMSPSLERQIKYKKKYDKIFFCFGMVLCGVGMMGQISSTCIEFPCVSLCISNWNKESKHVLLLLFCLQTAESLQQENDLENLSMLPANEGANRRQ